MGQIEFSILLVVLFGVYSFYKMKTMELAIEKREAMVPLVNEILNDTTASLDFKKVAVALFHLSIIPTSLPSLVFNVIKYRKQSTQYRLHLNAEHQQKFEKLLNEHFFKINSLCAPHYYVLLIICFFFLILVAAPVSIWKKYITAFQERVSDPACMAAVKY